MTPDTTELTVFATCSQYVGHTCTCTCTVHVSTDGVGRIVAEVPRIEATWK